MSTFEIGQTVTVAIKIYDSTGTLANVGGTMSCTVTRPDGTTAAGTVTNPSTGTYQAALTSTLAGRYRFVFTGTGTNSGGTPWTDVADVWPSDPRLIISLSDAKAALNFPSTARVNDDELRLYIAAATPVIEDIVGRVLSTPVTETFDGGRNAVMLSDRATTITSITVDGVALTASQYVADLAAGLIYYGSEGTDSFASGTQNVVVVYTAGASSIDPNIILAAREQVRFLYSVGQQGGRPSLGGTAPVEAWTPSGFAVPRRVIELCQPSAARRMPGLA